MNLQEHLTIRKAAREDIPTVLAFIKALAAYEHMEDQVVAAPEEMAHWICDKGMAQVNIAWWNDTPVGFTLYFYNFSTFQGKPGIWLEDLFVLPAYRGKGIGMALMKTLAREAVAEGFGRFEWCCLDWNEPSIRFYKNMGAVAMDAWTTYRLTGDALTNLANQD